MSDFFALEAGEYLERLDGMLAQGDSPSADEIVRLARALRGSALMANQPAIARAAAGLEVLARAVREGRRAWDPQTQQLALRAVSASVQRSEEHTSELQSQSNLVCRLLLEKKKKHISTV